MEKPAGKKQKAKMGFVDSIRVLAQSRYLMCIVVLVLAYGISANLVDISWKHNVKKLFSGSRQQYWSFRESSRQQQDFLRFYVLSLEPETFCKNLAGKSQPC